MNTTLNDTLEELLSHNINLDNLDFITISKLLTITDYLIANPNITIINEKLLFIISHLLSEINKTHIKKITYDFKLLNLIYALKIFSNHKDYENIQNDYLCIISNFLSLDSLYKNASLIKYIWPEQKFKQYIKNLSRYTLMDSILNEEFLIQQKNVYIMFYLSITIYDRGEQYKYLYKLLYKLFKKAIKAGQEELVFYLYTPLLFSWNGVAQTQKEFKEFNEKVEKRLEKFIKNSIMPKYKIQAAKIRPKNKKIKVAIFHERIINHSIFRVFYSLMKLLKENPNSKYEFIIYNLDFPEFGGSNPKSENKIKKLNFKYINLHKYLGFEKIPFYSIVEKSLKIRKKIIDDEIDILITHGSRAEDNFLITTRTCPIQIHWSHGNFKYHLNEIDSKICHFKVSEQENNYRIFLSGMQKKLLTGNTKKKDVKLLRKDYPKNKIILGSIGRLIKSDSEEYLDTVISIMQKNPNTIFLMCGMGDTTSIKKHIDKYGLLDRFYFSGHVDPHLYGSIIDIFLDTFPSRHGSSVDEIMAKGICVITHFKYLGGDELMKRITDFFLKNNLKKNYIYATTKEDYINKVQELIDSKKLRNDVGKVIYKIMNENKNKKDTLYEVLEKII